jgi:hypothetical protein
MVGYGRVCVYWKYGVRRSVLCSCVRRRMTSVAVKMFSYLIYFTKKFHKFCIFNSIFKDTGAINHITLQHKRFIAVDFDGSFSARFSRSNIKDNRKAPTVHVRVTHIPRAIFRFRTRVLLVEDPDLIQTVSS